jgi:hypothetical protein
MPYTKYSWRLKIQLVVFYKVMDKNLLIAIS